MKNLKIRAFGGLSFLIAVLAVSLLLPAWTLYYWQAWVFLGVFLVKEVDDFLSEIKKATIIIKESHPEICFYALYSNPMVFSKKNINGVFERKNILKKFIPDLDFILDKTFAKYNQNQANIDDFLDCLALAISAKLAFKSGNISKIPITEQIDSKSFIMQISYFLAPGF